MSWTGGRPQKWDEPTRQVSIRLPYSTLEAMDRMGSSRAEVIVRLVAAAMEVDGQEAFPGPVVVEPDHTHRFERGGSGLLRCRCGQVK